LRKIWWYINHSLDWLAYTMVIGGGVGWLIIKTFDIIGLGYLFDTTTSFIPPGVKLAWLAWLLFNSAGGAIFLILYKKYYYNEPFFIKYPTAEELSEMKAQTTEENIKFNKVMSADDKGNSSHSSAATSRRTHSAKGR